MKFLLYCAVAVSVLIGAFLWFINDRDRGLWLVNSAISLVQQPRSTLDIAFGDQDWQKLDVYPQATAAPVLVFIHGGSWRHGRKDQYYFAADAFHRLGYTVVVPDYLKYPDERAKFPSFAHDGAQAIAWVKANISRFNGMPDQLFVAGHSAGAHTALMLATDAQYLNQVGLDTRDLTGVAGIAGPYSFIPDWEVTKAVFGPPERYPLMDVLNYVDGDEPPTLLLHSKDDEQVGQYNQQKVADLMKQHQTEVDTVLYEGINHVDMVLHLHPWFRKHADVSGDIDRFFRARMTASTE